MSVTREEIYEQVWETPMVHLAKHYDLSKNKFADMCSKYNIPRPSIGYWNSRKARLQVKKIPLPKFNISIIEGLSKPIEQGNKAKNEIKQIYTSITIKDDLSDTHPLIKKSLKQLEKMEPEASGLIVPPGKNCLNITVSRKNMEKALLLMDAIIQKLEENGFQVSIIGSATQVKIYNVSIRFSMKEEIGTYRKPPHEHSLEGSYHFGHGTFNYPQAPNGEMRLSIIEPSWCAKELYRTSWKITNSNTLESVFNRFLGGLRKAAVETLKAKLNNE